MMLLKTDIALKSDINRGFLPFITAFMVFMACLVLATAITGGRLARGWDRRLHGSLIVQILPNIKAKNPQAELDERINVVKTILTQTPGIKSHGVISLAETQDMLKPFLGDVRGARLGIPLPRIISVELSSAVMLDTPRLEAELKGYSSLIGIEASDAFAKDFKDALYASRLLLGMIVLLILSTIGITIAYATRAGLVNNRDAIEIMHMAGAENRYIASRLSNQLTRMAIAGGALGWLAAILAIFAIGRYGAGIWPEFAVPPSIYLWLVSMPLTAAAITKAASYFEVELSLARRL
ncbi:MAG: hypothetical protein LBL52_00280 [Rickettsiales bacterium]|jgi:cell division transport system permease protein|nr:hypothetical protein [Rickettsiales bacterium]